MPGAAGGGWSLRPSRPGQRNHAIQALVLSGYVIIVCGGGGVPVVRNEIGRLRGIAAVIDKDHASSLLAQTLRADLLLICTGVEKVCLNFNTPRERNWRR